MRIRAPTRVLLGSPVLTGIASIADALRDPE
jgi:hypothetical protein